ncbi:AMP-binding protein [Streptomyces sp. NPDC054786]
MNNSRAGGHALYERFLRGLQQSPDRPAVRLGESVITYRAAHEQALLWAGALRAAERPADVVGVLAGKSTEAYVGILAGLCAGATVVPLHPGFPAARTRRMLELAGVTALIVDESGMAVLPETLGAGTNVAVLATRDFTAQATVPLIPANAAYALEAPRPVAPSDVAYMLFTSGSTGTPKGVPLTHGNTAHYFRLIDERYDFTPHDVFTQTFDLNFDCAMFDVFCAWGAAACVVPPPAQAYRDMPAFIAEHGVTVWFSTPSAIPLVRRMGGLTPGAMPGLRWSFFAGEALRCEDAADWQAAAPASAVENLYGPTELTVTVTAHRWDPQISPVLGVNGQVPIGTLHEGHEAILLTEDGGLSATEGELCITGPQRTPGYLDPAYNAGRFTEHNGRTWYRTGDRVRRLDHGELIYLGRLDAQVQVQGWRVELAEVEHALRECPGIDEAVTVPRVVDGNTELVVFYTGEAVRPAELAKALRQVLPQGMLPRHYEHVAELPLNFNRKVDRLALANRALELAEEERVSGRPKWSPATR